MASVKVYVKLPGRAPYSTHMSNKLENFHRSVEGYIETFTFASNACVVCNEEGRINGQPYNCNFLGVDFYGPIIFVGTKGEDFADFPIEWKDFKAMNPQLWEVE